jgi:hypothetical protein
VAAFNPAAIWRSTKWSISAGAISSGAFFFDLPDPAEDAQVVLIILGRLAVSHGAASHN